MCCFQQLAPIVVHRANISSVHVQIRRDPCARSEDHEAAHPHVTGFDIRRSSENVRLRVPPRLRGEFLPELPKLMNGDSMFITLDIQSRTMLRQSKPPEKRVLRAHA